MIPREMRRFRGIGCSNYIILYNLEVVDAIWVKLGTHQ